MWLMTWAQAATYAHIQHMQYEDHEDTEIAKKVNAMTRDSEPPNLQLQVNFWPLIHKAALL